MRSERDVEGFNKYLGRSRKGYDKILKWALFLIIVITFLLNLSSALETWSVDDNFENNLNSTYFLIDNLARDLNAAIYAWSLTSYNSSIYTCYVNASENVIVAKSSDNGATWTKTSVHSGNSNDAHNICTIGIDSNGYIHVSYDMHNDPLNYNISTNSEDISVFTNKTMTGTAENVVTYPAFYKSPTDELYFVYRDGGSGNGDCYIKKYNVTSSTWSDFATPLLKGTTMTPKDNAYWDTLVWDSNNNMHLSWGHRNQSGSNASTNITNYNVSYAMYNLTSEQWQNTSGTAYTLPINRSAEEVVVSTTMFDGLANTNSLYVDFYNRPHIAFVKDDDYHNSEIFHSYYNGTGWVTTEATDLNTSRTKGWNLGRPQMVIDSNDNVYLLYTNSTVTTAGNYVVLAATLYWTKSTDNGTTWISPTSVTLPGNVRGSEFTYDIVYFRDTENLRLFFQTVDVADAPLYMIEEKNLDKMLEATESTATTININDSLDQLKLINTSLAGLWRFEGSSGTIAYDNSSNSNNGTLTNMNYGINNGTSGWTSSGKVGNALMFDGMDDYVSIPNGNNLIGNEGTIQFWIKPAFDSNAGGADRHMLGQNDSVEQMQTVYASTGTIYVGFNDGGSWKRASAVNGTDYNWSEGDWVHMAWIYKTGASGYVKLYINGTNVGTDYSGELSPTFTSSNLIAGISYTDLSSSPFNGTIDKIAIFNSILLPSEFNYNQNYPSNCNGPICPPEGEYISPFHIWENNKIYDNLTIDASLNSQTATAVVQTSNDKFSTISANYSISLQNGTNTYPVVIQNNDRYVRMNITLDTDSFQTPIINFFNVTTSNLTNSIFYNALDSITTIIHPNGTYSWSRGISGVDTKMSNFTVVPTNDSVNITISNFTTNYKKWNETSSNLTASVNHTIGDFSQGDKVVINKDSVYWNTFTSNSSGYINFNYDEGFSTIILDAQVDNTSPTISSFSCAPTSVTTGQTITCSCSATDAVDSSPTISYTAHPSTSDTGTYTTTCTATDDAGNSASSSISYTISSDGGGGVSSGSSYTNTIIQDNKEFSEIKIITKELKAKERVRIKINNEEHHVGVDELTNTTATIEIFSTSQKTVFNVGDEKKFEVTDDDFYDIFVKLNSIENNKANLTIKSIYEEIPEEKLDGEGEQKQEEEIIKGKNLTWLWFVIGLVVILIIAVGVRFRKK